MKILVDENIPNSSVRELRLMGHDVLDIRRTEQEGLFDDELWMLAQSEQRLLITTDKGFFEHREESHFGILIVRLHQPNEQRIHVRIMTALQQFPENEWKGLLVAMRDTVRSIYRTKQ